MNKIERLMNQIDRGSSLINNIRLRIKLCQEILKETRQTLNDLGIESPMYGFYLTRLEVYSTIERDLTSKLERLIA